MTIIAVIAIWSHAEDNEHIMPYVTAVLSAVLAWMFYLLVTHSDPFKVAIPSPENGKGMNELLQNFYMAIHPPLLFIGYVATAVPFAYSMAALLYGDITEGWVKSVRRWSLVSFTFLSASITLGGRWAYVELGWAGYWAWDPVENSSLLPWLLCTALLHTLLVQEKLGHLKRLSLILSILTFFLTFFGTFLTRSGVVSSVHAFGEGPIGPTYLIFLAVLACISMLIYAWKAPSVLPSEHEKVWGVSKESALAVSQFLLIAFAVIVFIGTVFPIISEALTDQRISVQAPYFNIFAPYVGLGLVLMVGVGNLMRFQTSKAPGAKGILIISAICAIPLTAIFVHLGDIMATPDKKSLYSQLVGSYFTFFTLVTLFGDFWLKLKDIRFKYGLFFQRRKGYIGAFLAHVGFLIAILGFLGNYRGLEKKVTLDVGEKTELFGYSFVFEKGIDVTQEENVTLFSAPIRVSRGSEKFLMRPAQSRYPTKPGQPFNEIAVNGGLWRDVYIVLADFDQKTGRQATMSININPTVRFVWIAVWIMCIGGFIALLDVSRGNRSRDVVAGQWELK